MSFDLLIKNGNLQIGQNGDLQKVENTDKLVQDVLKIILTKRGGNPFFPFYGSNIADTVGMPYDFTNQLTEDSIRSALETLQKLQRTQMEVGQRMTASEILSIIQKVRIEQNQVDPRYIRVYVSILSKNLTTSQTSFDITL